MLFSGLHSIRICLSQGTVYTSMYMSIEIYIIYTCIIKCLITAVSSPSSRSSVWIIWNSVVNVEYTRTEPVRYVWHNHFSLLFLSCYFENYVYKYIFLGLVVCSWRKEWQRLWAIGLKYDICCLRFHQRDLNCLRIFCHFVYRLNVSWLCVMARF